MTEKTFWTNWVKPVLDQPPRRVANKVQDVHNRGLPDVDYCLYGASGKLELKYVLAYPVKVDAKIPIDTSVEQRRQLSRWRMAGGQCYVLLGIARDWFLLPYDVPTRLTAAEISGLALASGHLSQLEKLATYLENDRS